MSAYIVSKNHIDALVTVALDWGWGQWTPEGADALGTMLWKENHKSVGYRYSESAKAPTYTFKRRVVPLAPVEVLKAIGCYCYQTCEHKGWGKSEAKRVMDDLRDFAISKLPGYEAAAWGVD